MEKRFVERFKALEALDNNSTAKQKQQRGRDFEILISDVLENEGVLLERGKHTDDDKSEQVDGLIKIDHRNFLLEIKWQRSQLFASDLYAFQGKIDNKFSETKGLFISRNSLTSNFLEALTKGRSRSVLVIHGEDLNKLFAPEGPTFLSYLKYCIDKLSVSNIPHYSVADFEKHLLDIAQKAQIKKAEDLKRSAEDFIESYLTPKFLVNVSEMQRHYILSIYKDAWPIVEKFAINNYRNEFKKFANDAADKCLINHLHFLLYVQLDSRVPISIAEEFFRSILLTDITKYGNVQVFEFFRGKYRSLRSETHREFERSLLQMFRDNIGNYEYENLITQIYIEIRNYLSPEVQHDFFDIYLEIFISDRKEGSIQKDISFFLVTNEQIPKSHIEDWIGRKVKEIAEMDPELTDHQFFSRTWDIAPLRKYIGVADKEWQDYILNKFKEVKL